MNAIAIGRMHNQYLTAPYPGSVGELVAWMGAVQGQDYLGTLWSLGLRTGLDQAQAEAGYAQPAGKATIVRSWVLRGTLHFVAAGDLGWMVALLAPRLLDRLARRYRELELDEETRRRNDKLLVKMITAEGPLERKTLLARLEAAGISTAGQRGIHLLQHASLQGLIYQAAVRRNQAVFELCERLPKGILFHSREAALAELARRYFTTRGPATVQDFTWWSGLTSSEARQALEAVQGELASSTVDGVTYWMAEDTPAEPEIDQQRVYLLPGFDEYLISYKNRTASISPEHQRLWMGNTNGMLLNTIMIDGQVVGQWRRSLEKNNVRVAIAPFKALNSRQETAIRVAEERYAEFLGLELVV